jgi:hypothetical protein
MDNKAQPKPHPLPSADFNQLSLPIIESHQTWYRLNPVGYSSSIYFDQSGRGRFDHQQASYGILYVAEAIEGSFIECFGRNLGIKAVAEADIKTRNLFEITSNRSLRLVDLLGSGLVKIGADARVTSGSYTVSRAWVEAIYHHPQQVDGIRYYSRHDNDLVCCGLFERTKKYLTEINKLNLVDHHSVKLGKILNYYEYGLI